MFFTLLSVSSQKSSSGKRSQMLVDCGEHKATVIVTTLVVISIALVAVLLI